MMEIHLVVFVKEKLYVVLTLIIFVVSDYKLFFFKRNLTFYFFLIITLMV